MTNGLDHRVSPVLDAGQLRRIESTHRGFLYQHVYGAGCLLLAGQAGADFVAIERDEDLEIRLAARHLYVQVKTRSSPLRWDDIERSVTAYETVREEHLSKRRPLDCELWIVSSVAPCPSLAARAAESSWPADVRLLWPGCSHSPPPALPPAWSNIADGIAWCATFARALPYGGLLPETLTWKLAATVQFAATGNAPYSDHRIEVARLPALFELITEQLQRFPLAPVPYRELEDEPTLVDPVRLRIILGVPGAGKTSWAAEASHHTETPVAYFDAAQLPPEAVAPGIARELARAFLSDADAAKSVFAPGLAGIDSLRLLDRVLEHYSRTVIVVIDNAHALTADIVRPMLDATARIRWVLLAHPCSAMRELGAACAASVQNLGPWTRDAIVAEFASRDCRVKAETAERVRRVTGALPLFVRQAAALAANEYGGDVAKMCQDLEDRTHTMETFQETILRRVVAGLDLSVRDIAAVLSVSEVSLTPGEAFEFAASVLEVPQSVVAAAIRTLRQAGVLGADTARIVVHDSFRLVLDTTVLAVNPVLSTVSRTKLKEIVRRSFHEKWDFERLGFLLRLLVATGDEATVVDIATSMEERLHEYGMVPQVETVLASVVKSPTASDDAKFWAMDTLIFWNIQRGREDALAQQVQQLAALGDRLPPDRRRLTALVIKQILIAGRVGDAEAARRHFARGANEFQGDAEVTRVLKYDLALALFNCGRYEEVVSTTEQLIPEYYEVLGLEVMDVLGVNPPEIIAKLPDGDDWHDPMKRLADTLELQACSLRKLGRSSGFARLHAFKFFSMVSAYTSAIRTGQDAADELLEYGDPHAALQLVETTLLPAVEQLKLLDHLVQVRAHRAVLLAYMDRIDEARAEMKRLREFVASNEELAAELLNQTNLSEAIADGRASLANAVPSDPMVPPLWAPGAAVPETTGRGRVGRNDPCPCGSGTKYKKCCGR